MTRPGPVCQVCVHPDRQSIESAMLNGVSLRDTARRFGIGARPGTDEFVPDHKKLTSHRDKHMAGAVQAALEAREVASGVAIVDRLTTLDQVTAEVVERLREGTEVRDEHGPTLDSQGRPVVVHNDRALLYAVQQMRQNLELRAKLEGTLPEGDDAAVAASRAALENPAIRRMVAGLEDMLAEASTRPPGA